MYICTQETPATHRLAVGCYYTPSGGGNGQRNDSYNLVLKPIRNGHPSNRFFTPSNAAKAQKAEQQRPN